MLNTDWGELSPLEDAFCLDGSLFVESGEIGEYRKVFRRLTAAAILEAISSLHSSDPEVRRDAERYLRNDGLELIKELGIRNIGLLDDIIAHPPDHKALRCSDGRRERYLLHGQKCREKVPSLL